MTEQNFSRTILDLPRFRLTLEALVRQSIRTEYQNVLTTAEHSKPDWNFALLCASSLTSYELEEANEAVLRVAQSCLMAADTSAEQKRSALLLLERTGNQPAIDLALGKELTEPPQLVELPLPLALDAAARRAELTLTTAGNQQLSVNQFQKTFWEKAQTNQWLSISAPTSAGKSHVVRMWIANLLANTPECRIVYIAPTRALVEEVGGTFRRELTDEAAIHTLPWNSSDNPAKKTIHVLTQERLHILLDADRDFAPNFIFIDEAQKIGEGTRGILLSQVLDECVVRNPHAQLVFASPLTENPELLVDSAPNGTVVSAMIGESVTVTQNLVYVNQVKGKPRKYQIRAIYKDSDQEVGAIALPYTPSTSQRVPFIAAALGREGGANLIYANGPAQAEQYAGHIYRALGEGCNAPSQELADLIEFTEGAVHEKFLLATYLTRGVAFHYGDMPLVLKTKIEDLFKSGHVKFLVCTSTLLEGVNLPCKNIFIRNPKKGSNANDMTLSDFWNLAGRAGRWGKEFQGNIFCIDTDVEKVWREVPKGRVRLPMTRATDRVFGDPQSLVQYIAAGAPKAGKTFSAEIESVLSFVASSAGRGRTISQLVGVSGPVDSFSTLDTSVSKMLEGLTVTPELISRHAGISPVSLNRLRDVLLAQEDIESLALVHPQSDNAARAYAEALALVDEHLGGSFHPESRRHSLARLIVNWMKGVPLSAIIEGKAKWRRGRGMDVNYPTLIRKVMGEVEDIVRFEAPKFLSCYADLVSDVADELGVELEDNVTDVRLMLEMGVPRRTDMSFIGLGLSRATTMAIAPLVLEPELSEIECADWLKAHDFSVEDLPSFVRNEITSLLTKFS